MARPQRRDATARDGKPVAKRHGRLIALGLAALACFVLATLPASLVASRLQRVELSASSYSGTVWSGTATGLAWRHVALGDLHWRIRPMALLRGRVGADLELSRSDGSATAHASAGRDGALDLTNVHLDLPLAALDRAQGGPPQGWQGRARGEFAEIQLVAGWPSVARGALDIVGLVSPPPRSTALGSYHVVIPDPMATAAAGPGVIARVSDQGGPMSVDAELRLAADRSFLLEGTLAPRADMPQEMADSLPFLGPADAAGRRPFSMSGTF
jgi:general secretion pathway protein N